MKVTVVPLTSFVHGSIDAHEGKPFNCEKGLADEFERVGLVRIKRAPAQPAESKPDTAAAAKAPDDGAGQPSSASQAAQASPPPTLQPSATGAGAKRARRGAA